MFLKIIIPKYIHIYIQRFKWFFLISRSFLKVNFIENTEESIRPVLMFFKKKTKVENIKKKFIKSIISYGSLKIFASFKLK